MTAQIPAQMAAKTPSPQHSNIVGVFKTRESAVEARTAILATGIAEPKVLVEGYTDPEADVEAIGTTIGGEAGFLLGGFYGALISILVVTSIATWTDIAADSSFTRLLAVGLTLAGGLLGWLSGKQALANQPLAQKKKGNPDIPRSFCVRVNGSPSELKKARGVITQSRIDRSVEQVS
ncbi:MAG: hypothetical protein HLUCCA11_05105 [Phormidesmis priestleyi Ana]|uniref:Uncharacterized protein n=1 Tax=Phormidesmis priestleyi Ana TaxID=1666911 RepID=A0A0P8C584_9CYAN|nr:MAG: hypothetical protein HLUCCA11_05105 [Phormidesmis priestleyi Ana]